MIDKFQFVMTFVCNPLLTKPLRIASTPANVFEEQSLVPVEASMIVQFPDKFVEKRLPLTFVNQQPGAKRLTLIDYDPVVLVPRQDEVIVPFTGVTQTKSPQDRRTNISNLLHPPTQEQLGSKASYQEEQLLCVTPRFVKTAIHGSAPSPSAQSVYGSPAASALVDPYSDQPGRIRVTVYNAVNINSLMVSLS